MKKFRKYETTGIIGQILKTNKILEKAENCLKNMKEIYKNRKIVKFCKKYDKFQKLMKKIRRIVFFM
jgi:cell fate (sporulation/competence/biofilm development) regulator YlbF (YheA/YmcA/DUF963 family)